jgi:thiamine biosynthesis lipoprotein
MNRLLSLVSEWDGSNRMAQLNESRSIRLEESDLPLVRLILEAERVRRLTAGRFSPWFKNASREWRMAREASSVVDARRAQALVVEAQATGVSTSADTLEIAGKGSFDTGGIGKGFVADAAIEFLKQRGARFARVSCSGDIRFWGPTEWRVEIEDPREEGQIAGVLMLPGSCAVSTSGDYRQCWTVNGRRYHHLIDPSTCLPGDVCEQVTIVAPTATLADALATGLFFFDPAESSKIVDRLQGVSLIGVSGTGKVTVSTALERRFLSRKDDRSA